MNECISKNVIILVQFKWPNMLKCVIHSVDWSNVPLTTRYDSLKRLIMLEWQLIYANSNRKPISFRNSSHVPFTSCREVRTGQTNKKCPKPIHSGNGHCYVQVDLFPPPSCSCFVDETSNEFLSFQIRLMSVAFITL